jgi:hypothetical protein
MKDSAAIDDDDDDDDDMGFGPTWGSSDKKACTIMTTC